MKGLKVKGIASNRRMLLIEPDGNNDLAAFAADNAAELEQRLIESAAILFRGFDITSVEAFERVINGFSSQRMHYTYGISPRKVVGDRIFTASEYPRQNTIPLHNECAYQPDWPQKIAFCCLYPADVGGETSLADMNEVNNAIGQALIDKFECLGVRYVRHYMPHIDVPWQEVFQTDDRNAVSKFCHDNEIEHEWLDAETLRTTHVCQGVAHHPVTHYRTFFNQAHLFHISSLPPVYAKSLINQFGARLPKMSYYADGRELGADEIARIHSAFQQNMFSLRLEAGDLLLLDNMQVAHGRRPFQGRRAVLAALLDPYSGKDSPLSK